MPVQGGVPGRVGREFSPEAASLSQLHACSLFPLSRLPNFRSVPFQNRELDERERRESARGAEKERYSLGRKLPNAPIPGWWIQLHRYILSLKIYSICKFSDVNECLKMPHVCDKNAECINREGSFICTCLEGYAGNGYNCTSSKSKSFLIFLLDTFISSFRI